MTTAEEGRQAARGLAAVAVSNVGWAFRNRVRRALIWATQGRLDSRHDWPVVPVLGTPWQDNPSTRGVRWRERAAYLAGQPVFGVDYQFCRRCRVGWVEEPHTEEPYKRCGLATAGLAALRAEHPGLTWHTAGNHLPGQPRLHMAAQACPAC
jgi:hypothetical protein